MAATLTATASQYDTVTGRSTVTVSLPAHGPLDLVVVAMALQPGMSVPRRPPGGSSQPPNVDGWQQIVAEGDLLVLARWGSSSDPGVLIDPGLTAGGYVDTIVAVFSGTSERQGDSQVGATQTAPNEMTGPAVTAAIDGLAVSLSTYSAGLDGDPPAGWTTGVFGDLDTIGLVYQAVAAGPVASPVWVNATVASAPWYALTFAVEEQANQLVPLRSGSTTRDVAVFTRTHGEEAATFTEVTYRSDGTPPDPLPVLTPTHPWAIP